jgi:hypothetical protein
MDLWGVSNHSTQYHPGWFADTLPGFQRSDIGPIAVLRIDGDLYESVKVCMEHLYPLVSPGGYIIQDDYALKGPKTAIDEYFDKHGNQPTWHPIPDGHGPVWGVKK